MVYKVSNLQAPISLSGLQGFQKSLHAKLKKAKTHDIILSSLGGFAAILYLDTYYGPQVIHRSLDRIRVYCLSKKVNLNEISDTEKEKALNNAIDSFFPEHLSAYFTLLYPPLKQTDKEELEELYGHVQEALDEKGWHPEERFFIKALYEKYCKSLLKVMQKKLVEVMQQKLPEYFQEDFRHSLEKKIHSYVATTFNYWNSMLPKPPLLIKAISSDSKYSLVGFLSHPFKTAMNLYAFQNFLVVLPEILTKLNLIDSDTKWVKKIEKLAKDLSSQSEFFFLKKDRKVHYAIIDILIPVLIIYAFYDSQNSINKLGKHRFNELEKQPFSFSAPKHNLQCLDKESRKKLQKFFQSKNSIAKLSGVFKELLMEIIRDFEHFKEVESLIEKGPSSRFFYLASDSIGSHNSKESYLKKLKAEIGISNPKQQIVLVIDQICWNNLENGDLFKDFLEGIEDRKPKILLVGDDKGAVFDSIKSVLPPSYQTDQAQDISINSSINELLKSYFEDHPLASIIPNQHFLIESFTRFWGSMSEKNKQEKGISKCMEHLDSTLRGLKEGAVKNSGDNARTQRKRFIKITQLKKYQRSKILEKLKVEDFSTGLVYETPNYKYLQKEYKVLQLFIEKLKSKRKAFV